MCSCCQYCSMPGKIIGGFCSFCSLKLITSADWVQSKSLLVECDIKSSFVFSWKKNSSPVLTKFLYHLKGGQHIIMLEKLFQIAVLKFNLINSDKKYTLVYPKKINGNDFHAMNLSLLLRDLMGARIQEIYEAKLISDNQKNKNKLERKKILVFPQQIKPPNSADFIFIDDVLTTGSTAIEVWRSLGKPKSFQTLTVAIRELV